MGEGIFVTRAEFEELLARVRAIEETPMGPYLAGAIGGGITVDIQAVQETPATSTQAASGFDAKITGSSSVGDNQWQYTWIRVEKAAPGHDPGAWIQISGQTGIAYNRVESMNSAVGVQGNGVDVDGADYPPGFSPQPCPEGCIVRLYELKNGTGDSEYWFSYENADDGTCT